MAAALDSRTADSTAWSKPGPIAVVDFFTDLNRAEATWRSFETRQYLFTPYQRFDFLRHWQCHVGTCEGMHPLVVVAYDQERTPLGLLPLVLSETCGMRIARFMGGKHATFNMGIWNRDYVEQASQTELERLLSTIRGQFAVDMLAFNQQPLSWQGLPNPLALLPRQPSANDCPLMAFVQGAPANSRVSHSVRRRLNTKERKLKGLPGYRYHLAATREDTKRLLDAFFRIKPQRMAAQKLPNVFAEPGVEDFVREASLATLPAGGPVIEIHALECDSEVIALFAGMADGQRFSMMFNTYTVSENSRFSPGLILIRHIVDHYAERGYRTLDLGVGSDAYKRLFCKNDEPIFDCYVALSRRGMVAASAMSVSNRAKRLVKQSPSLLSFAHNLRHAFR